MNLADIDQMTLYQVNQVSHRARNSFNFPKAPIQTQRMNRCQSKRSCRADSAKIAQVERFSGVPASRLYGNIESPGGA